MSYLSTSEALSHDESSEENEQSVRYLLLDAYFLFSTRQKNKPSADDIDLSGEVWDGDQLCGYDVYRDGYKLIKLMNDLYENSNVRFVAMFEHENTLNDFVERFRKAAEDKGLSFPPNEAFSNIYASDCSTMKYDKHPKAAPYFIEEHIQWLFELRHQEVVAEREKHIVVVNQKRFAKEFQKLGYQTYQGARPYSSEDFSLYQTLHAVATHAGILDHEQHHDDESANSTEDLDSSHSDDSEDTNDDVQRNTKPKLSKTEKFVNFLFWAGMGLSIIGLIIYGSYQIHRWRHDKPLHYFKIGKKTHNPTEVITASSTEDDENSTAPTETQAEEKTLATNQVKYFRPKVPENQDDDENLSSDDSFKFKLGRKDALKPDYVDYLIKTNMNFMLTKDARQNISVYPSFSNIAKVMFKINEDRFRALQDKLFSKVWRRVNSRFSNANLIIGTTMTVEGSPAPRHVGVKPETQGFYNYYRDLKLPENRFRDSNDLFSEWVLIAMKHHDSQSDTPMTINTFPEELGHDPYYWYYSKFTKEGTEEENNQLFEQVHLPLIQGFAAYLNDNGIEGTIKYDDKGSILLTPEQTALIVDELEESSSEKLSGK